MSILEAKLVLAEARLKIATEALRFYADRKHMSLDKEALGQLGSINYHSPGGIGQPFLISAENGYVAAKAMKEIE